MRELIKEGAVSYLHHPEGVEVAEKGEDWKVGVTFSILAKPVDNPLSPFVM
jgi:hypothetical protein